MVRSGDHWDVSLPRSVCTAPTARRACGFETRVPAQPLSHFPKGETTLAKAATLVGDFPAPQCYPKRPSPYGGSDSKRRRKCLSFFCREPWAGTGGTSAAAREGAAAPPASARPAPAAGQASQRSARGQSQRPGAGTEQRLTASAADSISRRWATPVSHKRASSGSWAAGEAKRRKRATPTLPCARGTAAPAARPPRKLLCRV